MNRFTRLGLLSAAFLVFAPANARNFTPEDLVQLNRLGSSAVSADGSTLLFSQSETDLDANERHRDLWVLDLREPASAPERWRPSATSN
ncbi:MAG: S9 family peptidase, partial [Parasphingopyxis sp.]